jgi:hypothetical protein
LGIRFESVPEGWLSLGDAADDFPLLSSSPPPCNPPRGPAESNLES